MADGLDGQSNLERSVGDAKAQLTRLHERARKLQLVSHTGAMMHALASALQKFCGDVARLDNPEQGPLVRPVLRPRLEEIMRGVAGLNLREPRNATVELCFGKMPVSALGRGETLMVEAEFQELVRWQLALSDGNRRLNADVAGIAYLPADLVYLQFADAYLRDRQLLSESDRLLVASIMYPQKTQKVMVS